MTNSLITEYIRGGGGAGGASALDDLSDVDVSTITPENGDALVYSNGYWEPRRISVSGMSYDILELIENQMLGDHFLDGMADGFKDDSSISGRTLSNMEIVSDFAKLESGQTSGSVQFELDHTNNAFSSTTDMDVLLHAATPESRSGNSFVFNGNVETEFVVGKAVAIYKQIEQLGKTTGIWLTDSDGDIALLTVASRSYSDVTGKTTVTLSNTGSLDLDFDLSESEYPEKLRVAPFDVSIHNSSTGTGDLTNAKLIQASLIDSVGWNGSAFSQALEDASLTGTIHRIGGKMSKNKRYAIIRVIEDASSNADMHVFYSVDNGNTWSKFSTVTSLGYDMTNEDGYAYWKINASQLGVADSGDIVLVYTYYNTSSSRYENRAFIADLTDVTPALVGIADRGIGQGIIHSSGSVDYYGQVAYDPTDMSFIAIASKYSTTCDCFHYTTQGTVYDRAGSISSSVDFFWAW